MSRRLKDVRFPDSKAQLSFSDNGALLSGNLNYSFSSSDTLNTQTGDCHGVKCSLSRLVSYSFWSRFLSHIPQIFLRLNGGGGIHDHRDNLFDIDLFDIHHLDNATAVEPVDRYDEWYIRC